MSANLTGAEAVAKCVADRAAGVRPNLADADLRFADLRFADLTGADLTGADLRYANLTYAVGCEASA